MTLFNKRCSKGATPNSRAKRLGRLGFMTGLLIAAISVTGCSQDDTNSDETGELVLGLTDAAGDFSHYTVDVTQITLTKLNDAVVNVLPISTQVDFAQYTEMTEFLTAASVPVGVYKKATLSLDYSNADIWVENNSGESVKIENIVDTNGNAITTLDVSVRLEGRKRLAIFPGAPSQMTLDFDLKASNIVEFDGADVPTVIVEPLLVADLEFNRPKTHRVRGALARVNVEEQLFAVHIRPFNHKKENDRRFGKLVVKVNEKTVYDIDEQDYIGARGLEAMNLLPELSATVVIGDIKFNPTRFLAREVYAGSSVPGGSLDVVKGTVIARVGNTLTIRGATLVRAGGNVIFNDKVTVEIADTTKVKKQMRIEAASIDDISVGQRVSVSGTLTSDVRTSLALDATNGSVRMKITNLRGTTIAQVAAPEVQASLVVDLQWINRFRPAMFDFAGTGIDAANDADAMNYEIATGALDLTAIADNSPVLVKGFVSPFAQAPQDFDAISVTDFANVRASMAITWDPSTATPFTSRTDIDAVLNLSGVGRFHHFGQAGIGIDMNDLSTAPSIVEPADGRAHYIIEGKGTHQVYTSMATWLNAIDDSLANKDVVKGMRATGVLDQSAAEMIVRNVKIRIESAPVTVDPVNNGQGTSVP